MHLQAATITFAGADTTTGGSWRTSTVAKPLDGDGDNIYGTSGYFLLTSPSGVISSLPSFVSGIFQIAPFAYYGGHLIGTPYVQVDNPVGPGSVHTGTWFGQSGTVDVFARVTLQQNATFRMGVLVDIHDFADVTPRTLRVEQIFAANPGDSGFIASTLEPNRDADWYFFDISASAGDVLQISGENWILGQGGPVISSGIGGLSFDSIPEPGTSMLMGAGLLGLLIRRRLRSSGVKGDGGVG